MATALDPGRLCRALAMAGDVKRHGDGWLVAGYRVDPVHGCGCADALYRPGTACKHLLACRLSVLDLDLLAALREVAGG